MILISQRLRTQEAKPNRKSEIALWRRPSTTPDGSGGASQNLAKLRSSHDRIKFYRYQDNKWQRIQYSIEKLLMVFVQLEILSP